MRPFIDLNNLSYSKEKLIYYSQSIVYTWLFVALGLLIYAVYSLTNKETYMVSFLLLPIIALIIYKESKLLKRINEVQFRINSKGIQYRNEELVSWSNIKNERIETERSGRYTNYFFVYYIIDQDKFVKHDIGDLNTDVAELQHTLMIHRNRYLRENNIS
ncbi:hypothetical protein [Flavobacterium sp. LC2016-01]|uniref:hypothetical protein n=1 Tax=Flavobacterium sp. LC2016-01 TaxID=2675876 RepID=UPI0012BA7A63|nr:hypothetical protein [Flavobacterium sp. LC2016-01]MTH17296.1 hypothetical protein [Flavobacterium sp. LC2016-01]